MDLDGPGYGSPKALAGRIHELLPDLDAGFHVDSLARSLDIKEISDQPVTGFRAMLLTDPNKAVGRMIVAESQGYKPRRFSVAHELGHFLLPSHTPGAEDKFICSAKDMRLLSSKNRDRRERMEVEANEFAARLLIPLQKIRPELRSAPDLSTVVSLAERHKVSKEAMARSYAEHHDDPVAILMTQRGKCLRIYHDRDRFPWLAIRSGDQLPASAEFFSDRASRNSPSDIDEADPEDWLSDPERDKVVALREQVFWQRDDFALVMLEAEVDDID